MEDVKSASLKVLETYKEMVHDPEKCEVLCKDTECLMFLVHMLKDQEDEVIVKSLNILLMICEMSHCLTLSMIMGLVPSLNLLISSNANHDVQVLARKLRQLISSQNQMKSLNVISSEDYQIQEFSLRTPTRPKFLGAANSKARTVTLRIIGLENKAQRQLCEDELITVKGVISITFDLKKGYCNVRVRSDLKSSLLVEAVQRTKTMTAQEVVKNELGEETFVTLVPGKTNEHSECDPLPYLPEKDSPVKDNAIACRKQDLKRTTVSFLARAADFLTRSLYW